jgi:hypothetical protein
VAKRGRPAGATSRLRKPENVAAHHANVLLELWLAGASVLDVQVMLFSLASDPTYRVMIEDCWRGRGNERRHTVPPWIKRKLCQLAVAHVVELRLDAILRKRTLAAESELRKQGWKDTQIVEILSAKAPDRINFEAPDLKKVLNIVNRRAPATTLRRKKANRRILRN